MRIYFGTRFLFPQINMDDNWTYMYVMTFEKYNMNRK